MSPGDDEKRDRGLRLGVRNYGSGNVDGMADLTLAFRPYHAQFQEQSSVRVAGPGFVQVADLFVQRLRDPQPPASFRPTMTWRNHDHTAYDLREESWIRRPDCWRV